MITWVTEQRKLKDLNEWDKNPRQLSKHDAEEIAKSIHKFNLADPLVINTDNQIIGGHQRKRVMLSNGYKPDDLVDVRVPSRQLTEKEAEELNVRLNRNAGEWDFDMLANEFELDDLLEWGFTEADFDLEGTGEDSNNYSRTIEPPAYKPLGEKPAVANLFDDVKTRALVEAIDQAEGITDDERLFLQIAAQRHTVLSFKQIADYYAHSGTVMQSLMEDSALVIIDFDKAISDGYIKLTEELVGLVGDEYGND